ncbi:MAG: hypothetical protein JRE62_01120 [Deltaproteobacteria bacterium]|jgi:serine/threonine protein kinase|nr:hypothetical protein [Deltaproteobacteria bacterium]
MGSQEYSSHKFTSSQKYSDNSVVFDGERASWRKYLELSLAKRYEPEILVSVKPNAQRDGFEFKALNLNFHSQKLVLFLEDGFSLFLEKLKKYETTAAIITKEVLSNSANTIVPIQIKCSPHLPADSTREIFLDDKLNIKAVSIVLNSDLIHSVFKAHEKVSDDGEDERLGILWGLIKPLLHELGHSNLPRDRFFEEIHQVWCDCVAMRNIFFKNKRENGCLVPNKAGKTYIHFFVKRLLQKGIKLSKDDIFSQPFFKMLNHLHRLVGEDMLNRHDKIKLLKFDDLAAHAKVIVRGYLDDEYLRPSLSAIISGLPEAYQPMKITISKKGVETPHPKVGRYGIEDEEDLSAWNKVSDKFRKIGLVIVSQLGIGEFGRVYEAINLINPSWPDRVAVKVDRIYKKRKNEAIQVEDVMLQLSHDLSNSPHVISIYDAGLLSKKYTYHVLQLVAEGETLDELLGIGGTEPTSLPAIHGEGNSLQQLRQKFLKPIGQRSKRKNHRFTRPLTLNETISIMVSILLWVEKVHALGYSINDVKTGNVMINCRGQIKGIDLDFYQRAPSIPQVFMQDFFLLSWVCLLLFINAPRKEPMPSESLKEDFGSALQSGTDFLKNVLLKEWKFVDLSKKDAKVFLDCFVDIIFRSRANTYSENRDLFKQDINRLIYLKRLFFEREIVMTAPKFYNKLPNSGSSFSASTKGL